MYYEDEDSRPHDCGFDLPDTRHQFVTKEGKVSVIIVRHWYMDEETDDTDFKVSFDLHFDDFRNKNRNAIVNLPIGTSEDQACNIAHELWQEDEEATRELREIEAEIRAERRMGA